MPAPQIILDTVQRFAESRDQYYAGHYSEAQLRREFLDPFFESLGLDMNNAQNFTSLVPNIVNKIKRLCTYLIQANQNSSPITQEVSIEEYSQKSLELHKE